MSLPTSPPPSKPSSSRRRGLSVLKIAQNCVTKFIICIFKQRGLQVAYQMQELSALQVRLSLAVLWKHASPPKRWQRRLQQLWFLLNIGVLILMVHLVLCWGMCWWLLYISLTVWAVSGLSLLVNALHPWLVESVETIDFSPPVVGRCVSTTLIYVARFVLQQGVGSHFLLAI